MKLGPGAPLPLILIILVASAMEGTAAERTPVDVWCGGDDGLTRRLRDALESQFRSSPEFDLNAQTGPGTLVVTIPTHVDWKLDGQRTKVFYTVEFATVEKRKLATLKGSCWDDNMTKCATQIVKKAAIAARKIGSAKQFD
jgi:hypothetical protein